MKNHKLLAISDEFGGGGSLYGNKDTVWVFFILTCIHTFIFSWF